MKYTVISSSQREESNSLKISKYIQNFLEKKSSANTVYLFDMASQPLPILDNSAWEDESEQAKKWQAYSEKLDDSDAFVLVTPEWNGMASPALKNLFLFLEKEMAHKPALLVAVSSGTGGAYPIAELRMSSYKNSMVNYLPIHVIVRNCENVFNTIELDEKDEEDFRIKNRMNNSLEILESYAKAFEQIRKDQEIDLWQFKHGM